MKSSSPFMQIPKPQKKIFFPTKIKFLLDKSKRKKRKNKNKKIAH